ncbi:MAG TPA: hypothetical protein VGN17_05125 [Bryobacteraceae bacterium]|jgi:hypothetical protein
MNSFLKEHIELHPVVFAEKELGLTPTPKQIAALDALTETDRLSVKANNGGGKTSNILAPGLLWAMSKFPRSRHIITSASWTQLETQVQPNIFNHKERLPRWKMTNDEITAPNGSWARFISTKEAGRFEGNHGNLQESLWIWGDEAKSIPKPIFTAMDRCKYQRLILLSSTGMMMGDFYDSFNNPTLGFTNITITIDDCPHMGEEDKKKFFAKYGENHPLTRSALYAEFMGDDDLMAAAKPVKIQYLARAYSGGTNGGVIRINRHDRAAYLDFALGGDENVFCYREGNYIKALICWREKDSMAAVARFIQLFKEYKLKPSEVWAGADGIDIPICDAFDKAGWALNRVNANAKVNDEAYDNVAAQQWYGLGRAIERMEVGLPPDPDGILRAQLTDRYGVLNEATGKLRLESKRDLHDRGVSSPDRADAVAGVWWAGESPVTSWVKGSEQIFKPLSEIYEETESSRDVCEVGGVAY